MSVFETQQELHLEEYRAIGNRELIKGMTVALGPSAKATNRPRFRTYVKEIHLLSLSSAGGGRNLLGVFLVPFLSLPFLAPVFLPHPHAAYQPCQSP